MNKFWSKIFGGDEVPNDVGDIVAEWQVEDTTRSQRNKKWYIFFSLAVLAILIYCFFVTNYLLAVIVVLFVLITLFEHSQESKKQVIQISEDGIIVGEKFYAYDKIHSFWLAYNPPDIKYLYIDFHNNLHRAIGLPLADTNPLALREILQEYLDEDLTREGEMITDYVQRKLKL